jgi:hypothetical protein
MLKVAGKIELRNQFQISRRAVQIMVMEQQWLAVWRYNGASVDILFSLPLRISRNRAGS